MSPEHKAEADRVKQVVPAKVDQTLHQSTSNSTFLQKRKSTNKDKVVRKKRSDGSDSPHQFVCIYPGCGRSFQADIFLANHERTHTGARPFSCTWPQCGFAAATQCNVIQHICTVHLKVPRTKKDQRSVASNNDGTHMIDQGDPNLWLRVNQKLANQRLKPASLTSAVSKPIDPSCKVNLRHLTGKSDPNRPHYSGHVCTAPNCGQSFPKASALLEHERCTHLGVRPYGCTWPDCGHLSYKRSHVVVHIRTVHFRLPKTVKLQAQLGLSDERDPNQWIRVYHDELAKRNV